MKKKGSVTVFFSLFMAVLLILIQVIFHSVQIAGGRVQAETGVEEGLYSIFAGYHRELLNMEQDNCSLVICTRYWKRALPKVAFRESF